MMIYLEVLLKSFIIGCTIYQLIAFYKILFSDTKLTIITKVSLFLGITFCIAGLFYLGLDFISIAIDKIKGELYK